MQSKKINYPSLNGLRAISIIIVILSHLDVNFTAFPVFFKYFPFFRDGQLGVNVFFVISGFLITSLLLREENHNNTISLKNFYFRRVLRIFPAYYFLLLFLFILHYKDLIYINNYSWITALTYTKYFNWKLDWYTAHSWSLSIEENFYLVWPLVFIFGMKSRKIFMFLILITIPFFRIYNFFGNADWIDGLTIFCRMDAIATGCLFAIYKDKIMNVFDIYGKKIFYFSMLFLLSYSYLRIILAKYNLNFNYIIFPFWGSYGTLTNILIALVMMFSVFRSNGIWFRFLNLKIMNLIGILSYSLYLWQQVFTCKSAYFINKYPLNLIYLILASLISYFFIEKYFLKLKTKFVS
ncbi:MAG: acyltransferase [Bacteroidota bacterium]|nr:acyltransferase [Bacteroidota bacterium]